MAKNDYKRTFSRQDDTQEHLLKQSTVNRSDSDNDGA